MPEQVYVGYTVGNAVMRSGLVPDGITYVSNSISNIYLWEPQNTDHIGETWAYNRLQRMIIEGERVYHRCLTRHVEWPEKNKMTFSSSPVRLKNSNLDMAFSEVVHFMSEASKQCQKYYSTTPGEPNTIADKRHCCRFHNQTRNITAVKKEKDLRRSEDVHIIVPPGSYSVTSNSACGTQTHLVHTKPGQIVDLRFLKH